MGSDDEQQRGTKNGRRTLQRCMLTKQNAPIDELHPCIIVWEYFKIERCKIQMAKVNGHLITIFLLFFWTKGNYVNGVALAFISCTSQYESYTSQKASVVKNTLNPNTSPFSLCCPSMILLEVVKFLRLKPSEVAKKAMPSLSLHASTRLTPNSHCTGRRSSRSTTTSALLISVMHTSFVY